MEGHALAALAELDLEREDLDAARRRLQESLEIRRELGDRRGGWMLYRLAEVESRKGSPETAQDLGRAAAAAAAEVDDPELASRLAALENP